MDDHKTHKYMRVRLGKNNYVVFKCMVSGCPHYIRRELAVGRESICWRCNQVMTLTMANTLRRKPHHLHCRRRGA